MFSPWENQWQKQGNFLPCRKVCVGVVFVFVATFSKILPFADIKKDHKSPHNGAAGYIYISSGEQLRLMEQPKQQSGNSHYSNETS